MRLGVGESSGPSISRAVNGCRVSLVIRPTRGSLPAIVPRPAETEPVSRKWCPRGRVSTSSLIATLTPGTIWASSMTAGRRNELTHRNASSCARSAIAGSVSDW